MKICAFLLRPCADLVGFAATMALAGCAGVSTEAVEPPPPPSTHSVYLSWNASISSDISGYNIYRAAYANSCGSFSRINSALTVETIYTDSAVANGASYCYTTTAVNAKKEESGFLGDRGQRANSCRIALEQGSGENGTGCSLRTV